MSAKKLSIYCLQTSQLVRAYAEHSLPAKVLVTTAYKKNDGRIFGGQFLDGISNAVDAISMMRLDFLNKSYVIRCVWQHMIYYVTAVTATTKSLWYCLFYSYTSMHSSLGHGKKKKLFLRPSLPKICSSPYFLFFKLINFFN